MQNQKQYNTKKTVIFRGLATLCNNIFQIILFMRKRFLCFACLHVCELVWMKVHLTKIFANEVQYAKRQNLIIV